MKRASLLTVLAVLLMAGQLTAATTRYKQSGDWFDTEAVNGNGWQAPGVPGTDDVGRLNWGGNTVTLAGAALLNRLEIGVDESGILEVNSGGVLTTNQDVRAGNNNAAATGTLTVNNGGMVDVGNILWAARNDSTGFININSGGVVNVASHLWWGSTGTATINISGTLNQTGGILGLGTSNAGDPGGGTAQANILDGGLLALNNIHGAGTSIQPGSVLDVSGTGQVTLPGDFVGVINNQYIAPGKITGDGVVGNAQADLTTNPGFTTITVIPEPSTMLLLGLALGGLLIRKAPLNHGVSLQDKN